MPVRASPRSVRRAFELAACFAVLPLGCGGRTVGSGRSETGSVGASAGATASAGMSVAGDGASAGLPAGAAGSATGGNSAIGSACASDSDCADGTACAFRAADGCSALGSCQAAPIDGPPCTVEPACTCAGTTDVTPRCGLGGAVGAYTREPIAHDGPCDDGGPLSGGDAAADAEAASEGGSCSIRAADYDQSCATDSDCVGVHEGELVRLRELYQRGH